MLRTPFQIVLGTHEVTPVPTVARAHGLRHRFALVQSTHHPAAADMVVDPLPLLAVLRAVDRHTDLLGTLFWDEQRQQKITRFELEPHYRSRRPDEYDYVSLGEWRRAASPCVLLFTESWNAVGGPAPYHDSLTYSFYSETDLSELLLAALAEAGHHPTRVIHAESTHGTTKENAPGRWPRRIVLGTWLALVSIAFVSALCVEGFDEVPRWHNYAASAGRWLAIFAGLSLAAGVAYTLINRFRHRRFQK